MNCHPDNPCVVEYDKYIYVFCNKCKKLIVSFPKDSKNHKLGNFRYDNINPKEFFEFNKIPITVAEKRD